MARVIAFGMEKGGVGKTTGAVNFAAVLADRGNKRVLLVDCDPQSNATSSCGIVVGADQPSIYEALTTEKKHRVKTVEAIYKTEHGFDILPAVREFAVFTQELTPAMGPTRFTLLRAALAQVADDYEYIVLDLPPGLGPLTINGLTAATDVVMPVLCEILPTAGLVQLLDTIEWVKRSGLNPNLQIAGAYPSKYEGATSLHRTVRNHLRRFCHEAGIPFVTSYIKKCVRFGEAPDLGVPAVLASNDHAVQNFRLVVKETLGL